jgi:hypothetical protein
VGATTTPEPIGTPDAAATLFQVLLVALILARSRGLEARLTERVRGITAAATMALIPAIGRSR